MVWDDIAFAFRAYDPALAYGQSKTADVLFAVGATAHWADDGITANALMPGGIATGLQRHMPADYMETVSRRGDLFIKSVEQGAATSVLLATWPGLEGIGGRYFDDCNEAEVVSANRGPRGVAPYALDPDNAERLWELSLRLTG